MFRGLLDGLLGKMLVVQVSGTHRKLEEENQLPHTCYGSCMPIHKHHKHTCTVLAVNKRNKKCYAFL